MYLCSVNERQGEAGMQHDVATYTICLLDMQHQHLIIQKQNSSRAGRLHLLRIVTITCCMTLSAQLINFHADFTHFTFRCANEMLSSPNVVAWYGMVCKNSPPKHHQTQKRAQIAGAGKNFSPRCQFAMRIVGKRTGFSVRRQQKHNKSSQSYVHSFAEIACEYISPVGTQERFYAMVMSAKHARGFLLQKRVSHPSGCFST